ncbi:MAG TPA: hypothetical protein VI702_02760 [Nitrospiria bacterium]
MKRIPENHSLRKLFSALTERVFIQNLNWPALDVAGYLADMLTDFSDIDRLYKILNSRGGRLDEVSSMMLEADFLLNAGSVEREREVHRHIGDFTLFMAGLFPEFLKRIKLARLIHHPDFLIDYIKVGKHSYRNVSEINFGEFRDSSPLFRKMADHFELCVLGLGYLRDDLKRAPGHEYHPLRPILLN